MSGTIENQLHIKNTTALARLNFNNRSIIVFVKPEPYFDRIKGYNRLINSLVIAGIFDTF